MKGSHVQRELVIHDIKTKTSLNRMQELVFSRYGKRVILTTLVSPELISNQSQNVHANHYQFSIQNEDMFLANAILKDCRDLSQEMREEIAELVQFIAEPILQKWVLSRHSFVEENTSNSSKVVSLFGDSEKSLQMDGVLVLECDHSELLFKVAHQIHEVTHRWAFVKFSDVSSQISSSDDISQLGAMTIFIENLQDLSTEHQKIISAYFHKTKTEDEPIILIGSSIKLEVLQLQNKMEAAFIKDLIGLRFKVDRFPLSYSQLSLVIERIIRD